MISWEIDELVEACDYITDALHIVEKYKDRTEELKHMCNLLKFTEDTLNKEIHRLRE